MSGRRYDHYMVVNCSTLEELEQAVSGLMGSTHMPHGSMICVDGQFMQPMLNVELVVEMARQRQRQIEAKEKFSKSLTQRFLSWLFK